MSGPTEPTLAPPGKRAHEAHAQKQAQTEGEPARKHKAQEGKAPSEKETDGQGQKKWWDREQKGPNRGEEHWKSLEHHGVMFSNPYQPAGLKILINQKEHSLTPEQEEVCGWWVKMIKDPAWAKEKVIANFLKELVELFGGSQKAPFKSLSEIDFSPVANYWTAKDEEKKTKPKEEKEKLEKLKNEQYYGYAIVDGTIEKVSSYLVEPPGIFRGRGEHPRAGKLKPRIWPESVSINVGEDDPVPKCPVPGLCWGEVVHKHEATWLASYKDIQHPGSKKYVFLDAGSKFKGQNDMKKYEKARKLKNIIESIRKDYCEKMKETGDSTERQLGTATYLIDKLALRVGNEKGEDEADTVGCCSLRVEHIKILEDNKITLDFLGKDSMRYFNTVSVDPLVHKNLASFVQHKKPSEDLFEKINASKLNDYLKSFMPDLSAKVFRTFNASVTLQKLLSEENPNSSMLTLEEKFKFYTDANREVAILCNHQKTVAKNFNEQVEKLQDKLKELLQEGRQLEELLVKQETGKRPKKEKGEKEESVLKKVPTTAEQTMKMIKKNKKKVREMENKLRLKEDNKAVALGTSKINYMDPRISISWCKKKEVPIEKIFSTKLRSKFCWGMSVEPNWKF